MTTELLVVGERFNRARYRPSCCLAESAAMGLGPGDWTCADHARHYAWLDRVGAFVCDPQSRRQLARLGVPDDSPGLNLTMPDPQDAPWDSQAAMGVAYWALYEVEREPTLFLLCGRRVQQAFFEVGALPRRASELGYGEVHEDGVHRLAILPHPSEPCRVWNDSYEVERIKEALGLC